MGVNRLNEVVPSDQQIEGSEDYLLDRIPRRIRSAGKGMSEVVEGHSDLKMGSLRSDFLDTPLVHDCNPVSV
jgi:hypothetical protein